MGAMVITIEDKSKTGDGPKVGSIDAKEKR